jgi:hypothetical protein
LTPDERSGPLTTSQTDDNITAVDKMVKHQNVTSQLIADTLGILKTVVLWILRGDLKKQNCAQNLSCTH